jgi:hypothetical protein
MLQPVEYEVWPEHEDAVMVFLRCQTQWRVGSGGVTGLDYGVILQMMALYDVPERAKVMEDLQVMESRAIELFGKAAKKEASKPAKGRKG